MVDTYKHKDYFSRLFNIDPEKFYVISVSTNEDLFIEKPTTPRRMDNEAFDVFFYGSFQPLHGVNVILEAAAALKRSPITFTIVGGNRKKFSEFNRLTQSLELDNVTYIKWIEYQQLPEFIQNADLCLGGPFGNTGQSQRVITGKTFQFLAMGRPVVIGETDLNYGFVNKVNCLLVRQGDAEALVDVIWWAYQHRDKLPKIGQKGRELYHKRFSVACIQKSLEVIFES